jgi:hypothetical protein
MASLSQLFVRVGHKMFNVKDILERTVSNASLPWNKSLRQYYFRPEWELFDLKFDPREEFNAAEKASYQVSISMSGMHMHVIGVGSIFRTFFSTENPIPRNFPRNF